MTYPTNVDEIIKLKKIGWGAKFNCLNCRNEKLTNYWSPTLKFCSNKCYGDYTRKRIRKVLNCPICKKDFEVKNYVASRSKYCSLQCTGVANRGTSPDEKLKKVNKTCKFCNKNFFVWSYRKDSALFCSRDCKHKQGQHFGNCNKCKENYTEEINITKTNRITKFYCSKCRKLVRSRQNSGFQLDVFSEISKICIIFEIECIPGHTINIKDRRVWPDIVINSNIILECQGDYYHCNPSIYDREYKHVKQNKFAWEIWEKDEYKKILYTEGGYKILYIWESDWYKNREQEIDRIKKELYEISKNT